MSLDKTKIEEIIKSFGKDPKDTGSSEVQIALLTERITYLTEHFKTHRKDNHSRRGLIHIINKRNKLLKYVYNQDHERYRSIVKKLGIRAKYDRHHA